jgi:tRNA threonylcarbamoyladenosine biosynthesis protein TsaB
VLELVSDVLERGDLGWDDIDRIAVGVGPGTFTGLRIGVATARALARARQIALTGVSTLQSVACNAATFGVHAESVFAVLDARRGEVFAAGWRHGLEREPPTLLSARACAPERLAEVLETLGSGTLAVGEGAVEFREVLERAGALVPDDHSAIHRVSAVNHCRLALSMRGSSPDHVQPDYLRLPDAEIGNR